jgi:hypothetical protein
MGVPVKKLIYPEIGGKSLRQGPDITETGGRGKMTCSTAMTKDFFV